MLKTITLNGNVIEVISRSTPDGYDQFLIPVSKVYVPIAGNINAPLGGTEEEVYQYFLDEAVAKFERLTKDKKFDLVSHLRRQKEFSEKTFGPGKRTAGVIDHIRKELIEIEEHPDDISEWVDVIILAFDGAWRAGWDAEAIVDAIVAKQTKNESREWPDWRTSDPNKAIEHVRVSSSPNAYWDLWDNYNQMEDSFIGSTYSNWNIESDEDVIKLSMIPDKVLAAAYHYENYEGSAFVLFVKDGKLYEVNGSHCSCYGLEGQWEPELVDIESLEHRIKESLREPEWGFAYYHGKDFAEHVLRELQEFVRK